MPFPGPGLSASLSPGLTLSLSLVPACRLAGGRGLAAAGPGALWSRYAGAMLLHAFLAQAGAGTVLASAGGEPRDVALLTAVSMSFALGAATTEQFKTWRR